jgi:hypothetical protein
MHRLVAVTLAAACRSAPPPPPVTASAPIAVAPVQPAVAPTVAAKPAEPPPMRPEVAAGLYWEPYATCYDCDRPTAVVAYVVSDAREASAIVDALHGKLAFGLPYVVHTDDLGIAPRGIAVVIGNYGDRAAATEAATAAPVIARHHAAVHGITTADDRGPSHDPPSHVTVVDRGAPVPAWSKRDVDRATAALDKTEDPAAHATLQAQHAWVQRELANLPPLCVVKPGEMFVVQESELRYYEFAPVRCGGQLAYIPWTKSLLGHAVIVPDRARGTGYQLIQVVGAECDSPVEGTWRYDHQGRHDDSDGGLVAVGSCGG